MFWENLLQSINNSSVGTAIMLSGVLFPILESIHVLALVLVVGSIAIVDIRLLGFGAHRRSAGKLIRELLPYTWIGFAVAVISGLLLFSSNAVSYWESEPFRFKMLFILLAGLNMAVFHLKAYRSIESWDDAITPPVSARLAGVLSLLAWVVVLFLGRWIGFAAPFVF